MEVDPSTIMRWVHRYAPELEKRVRAYQGYGSTSWRVDETYIKVGGKWKYLFRAVDKHGVLIDFMLSDRRNTRAAHRFLAKALRIMRNWPPSSITTDKRALLQQSGRDRGARDVALPQRSSRLEVQRFTEDRDSFRERTDTDAEGAFHNARITVDVLGEVEDRRLTFA